MHSKLAYDLKFTAGGIRRQVIRCTAARHRCEDCKLTFLPKRYKRRDKHLHGLKSWAMYQHVVHRISFQHLEAMFEDCFGLRVGYMELHDDEVPDGQTLPADAASESSARIVAGGLVHADETHVNLQKGKGYVWVLTNLEDVAYMYRPSREADFLQDLLRDFKGVLVSDFYTGYDSLPCEQQKCLVHLIRDINGDLMGNPYDEEFKALAGGVRQAAAVHRRHDRQVRAEEAAPAQAQGRGRPLLPRPGGPRLPLRVGRGLPEAAPQERGQALHLPGPRRRPLEQQQRRARDQGVRLLPPRSTDGQMSEEGLSDYLVLLSVYQTCKYRGVSFLKFLLSREEDVEAYLPSGGGGKRARPALRSTRRASPGIPQSSRKGEGEGGDGGGRPGKVR